MTNYVNPESFYPLKTGDARSTALGAGTVPGSFLAGMMLPERMNDYRNVRDSSLDSSLLNNQRVRAENETYALDAPLRDITRRVGVGAGQNTLALQPGELKTGARKQFREYTEEGRKVHQAVQGMKSDERQAVLGELVNAATVLQMFRDENGKLIGKPEGIAREMKKMGIDVDPQYFEGLNRLHPEELKQMHTMSKETFKETQATGRTLEEIEGRERVANIAANAKDNSAASVKENNRQKLLDEYAEIVAKEEDGAPLSSKEKGRKAAIEMAFREFSSQQQAIGDREAEVPAQQLGRVKELRDTQKSIQERFEKDPNMKNYKLGPFDPKKKRYTVINPETGTEIGWYE